MTHFKLDAGALGFVCLGFLYIGMPFCETLSQLISHHFAFFCIGFVGLTIACVLEYRAGRTFYMTLFYCLSTYWAVYIVAKFWLVYTIAQKKLVAEAISNDVHIDWSQFESLKPDFSSFSNPLGPSFHSSPLPEVSPIAPPSLKDLYRSPTFLEVLKPFIPKFWMFNSCWALLCVILAVAAYAVNRFVACGLVLKSVWLLFKVYVDLTSRDALLYTWIFTMPIGLVWFAIGFSNLLGVVWPKYFAGFNGWNKQVV